MAYRLVGVQQVLLHILCYLAEHLLAAVENDPGGLHIVKNAQGHTQQYQQQREHHADMDMQRKLALFS